MSLTDWLKTPEQKRKERIKQVVEDLTNLHTDFTKDVVTNVPNYTDNDFTFDKFIAWIKHKANVE